MTAIEEAVRRCPDDADLSAWDHERTEAGRAEKDPAIQVK